jgi:acetylglutamate kinase
MMYVIKFGGNAISGKEDMQRLSREIAVLAKKKAKMIIVHGGGPEISAEMEKRGLTPTKVAGLRITDKDGLDAAEYVLSNLNKEMTECLTELSLPALGMPGHMCSVCKKKEPYKVSENGKETTVDLGLVGEVAEVNTEALQDLLDKKIIPVIYPIGADENGDHLNINADTMAAGIAAAIMCTELITITDVPGILMDVGDPSSKIDNLTLKEIDGLISSGVISGGMIPKVEACRDALNAGVKTVRMVNGKDKRSILTDILNNVPVGTIITK